METIIIDEDSIPVYDGFWGYKNEDGWKCPYCKKETVTPEQMKEHFESEHFDEWKKQQEMKWSTIRDKDYDKYHFDWSPRIDWVIYDCTKCDNEVLHDVEIREHDVVGAFGIIPVKGFMFDFRKKTPREMKEEEEEEKNKVDSVRISQRVKIDNIGKHIQKAMWTRKDKPDRIIVVPSGNTFTIKAEYEEK